jgi:putative transport protein
VPQELLGKTIAEIRAKNGEQGLPLRARRNGRIIEATDDIVFEEGDIISVIGSLHDHESSRELLGSEFLDPELLNYNVVTKEIIAITTKVVGKTLGEINIPGKFGCFVRSLSRASIDLPINSNTVLNKGDRLYVTGEESRLNDLATEIGRIESEETQTDLLTFSTGIGVGVLIGMIMLKIGVVSIGLGSAGGLLLVGILLGFLRSMSPTFGGMPPAARNVLMEFGLALFMAGVGLGAGAGIVEGFKSAGLQLIGGGVIVTLVPVLVAYFIGRKFLKMNPAILLGSITGSMTSEKLTPAVPTI